MEALKDKSLGGEALSGPRDQALIKVKGSNIEGSEAGSKECRNAGMKDQRIKGLKD